MPQPNDNSSDSTDLKLILLNHLDAVRAEQSKLIDLVNKQSKKLDFFEKKFTSELSEFLKMRTKYLKITLMHWLTE